MTDSESSDRIHSNLPRNVPNGSESSSLNSTEDQVNQLQNEILGQGREIQQFIEAHAKLHKPSAAFRALMTLFDLFKSELSMNFALRQALMKEKSNTEGYCEAIEEQKRQIEDFLRSIATLTQIEVPDLRAVYDCIAKQLEEQKTAAEAAKRKLSAAKANYAKIERENSNLQKEIESLRRRLNDQEVQFSIELVKVTSRAELAEKQNAGMKSKYDSLSQKVERQKKKIRQLKADLAQNSRNSSAQINQLHSKITTAETQ
jgi:chromosome segregation ATPase